MDEPVRILCVDDEVPILKAIANMINYTAHHFFTEEKYFAQYGYPDTEEYIKAHRAFVDKVNDFKKKFDTARIGLNTDIINFLSDWLKKHIQGTDKKYGPFLNEKGLS
jgi:hemerythrin